VATPLKSSLLVEPYAIASRDLKKAQVFAKKWDFSTAYGSYEELIKDPKVDLIYNPLPNHLHLEYIKKAADAGKPMLCEKPLCLNAKEAAAAAKYCQKKGVPLMEAFMYRFHPQWIRAKEIVKSGELGRIMGTGSVFSYTNKDPANIRNIAGVGGGALLDIGCYTVSTSRLMMEGEPLRAVCTFIRDPVYKTDIFGSAILDYGEGRTSTFTVGTQIYPYQRVTAYGTEGALSVEVPFNMYGDIPGRITVNTGVGERIIETEIADQYLQEFDTLAQAIIEKTGAPTPMSDAVTNMAVLDALFASQKSGAWEPVARY
jgi:predicted dehydrogenase